MVAAVLLLALAQPAEPVPVCTMVTPGGQNIGFFIGGDDAADHIRLSATPGAVRWAGGKPGSDNDAVFGELLGLPEAERRRLAGEGVI